MKLLKSVGGYVVISCIESTMWAKTVIVSKGVNLGSLHCVSDPVSYLRRDPLCVCADNDPSQRLLWSPSWPGSQRWTTAYWLRELRLWESSHVASDAERTGVPQSQERWGTVMTTELSHYHQWSVNCSHIITVDRRISKALIKKSQSAVSLPNIRLQ